jgi:O-antigen/teichoic acid export membrane protein
MKFIQHSLMTLLTRVLTLVFSLCVLIMTTRVLGPEGRGVFELVILVLMVSKTVSSLGIEVGNVYFTGRSRIPVQKLGSNSLVFSAILGSAAILLFIGVTRVLPLTFIENVPEKYLIHGIFVIPFLLLFAFFSMLLLGENRFLEFNLVNLAHPVLLTLALILGLLIFQLNVSYTVYSWILLYGVVGIGTVFIQKKRRLYPFRLQRPEAKITVGYGLKAYFANLIQFFNLRFDIFLVNHFLTLKEVGYYSLSVRMAEILLYLPAAAATVVFPKVANTDHDVSNRDTPVICRNVLFLLILSTLLFAVLAHVLFPLLFSEKFAAALKPFLYLLPGIIALGCNKILANDVAGRGKPEVNMVIAAVTLIMNVILNILLIPKLKIIGAALSSSITYTISTILLAVIFKRMTGISFRDMFVIKRSDLKYYNQYLRSLFGRFKTP